MPASANLHTIFLYNFQKFGRQPFLVRLWASFALVTAKKY